MAVARAHHITALYYETVGGSPLLHEISQRLYYLPIIYMADRYGLRGGLTASILSAELYFPHIVQHWADRFSAINQYAETILFLVIGIVTGLLRAKIDASASATNRRTSSCKRLTTNCVRRWTSC